MNRTAMRDVRHIDHSRACSWGGMLFALAFMLAPVATKAADAAIERKAETCIACHGAEGQSTTDATPSLAGQTARYLDLQLQEFKTRQRNSATMSPIAETLSSDDIRGLAAYFSGQPQMSTSYVVDQAKIANGKAIAAHSQCATCHEADFTGHDEFPRIAGQQYHYIVKALTGFRSGRRHSDGGVMEAYTRGMTDDAIESLAEYLATLTSVDNRAAAARLPAK